MNNAIDTLYVHVPFCVSKCDYCAFHSTDGIPERQVERYLERLDDELASHARNSAPLRSLFFGGGTPNALSPRQIERLIGSIHRYFKLGSDCEFTVECNPTSMTAEKLSILRDGGVNRISIGIQSFNPRLRKIIGRGGNLVDVRTGLDLVANAMDNFSCDLIFGIPEQTIDDWVVDLNEVAASGASHVSTYSLTIEPSTPLHRRRVQPVDDDPFLVFWNATDDTLGTFGLERYEVSNFSKPGRRCRHNDDLWHGRAFAAAGPAAHGFDGTRRYANQHLSKWLAGKPATADELTAEERAVEIFIVGLRTVEGWNLQAFEELTGMPALGLRGDAIESLCAAGILEMDDSTVRPTKRGLLLNDWLGGELI